MTHAAKGSLICLGCACFCEDALELQNGRPVKSKSVECAKCDAWLAQQRSEPGECTISGKSCSLDDAIDEIARQLSQATAPLFCGWSSLLTENQRRVVQLAQRFGGYLDWTCGPHQVDSILALQRSGHVGCTYGEIKNRADLVVFWRVDVDQIAPRFVERFVRTENIVKIGGRNSEYEEWQGLEFISAIKSKLANRNVIGDSDLEKSIQKRVDALLPAIRNSSYCVIVVDSTTSNMDSVEREQLTKLIMRLNDERQVRLVDLGSDDNSHGAENVMTWLTGFPAAAKIVRDGMTSFRPSGFSSGQLELDNAIDLTVVIGSSDAAGSAQVPRIEIGSCDSRPEQCLVQIPFESDFFSTGTVFRGDGVPLPIVTSESNSRTIAMENVLESIGKDLA